VQKWWIAFDISVVLSRVSERIVALSSRVEPASTNHLSHEIDTLHKVQTASADSFSSQLLGHLHIMIVRLEILGGELHRFAFKWACSIPLAIVKKFPLLKKVEWLTAILLLWLQYVCCNDDFTVVVAIQ
jgi:aromatic ring-opening dioxygenase LigB subunit